VPFFVAHGQLCFLKNKKLGLFPAGRVSLASQVSLLVLSSAQRTTCSLVNTALTKTKAKKTAPVNFEGKSVALPFEKFFPANLYLLGIFI